MKALVLQHVEWEDEGLMAAVLRGGRVSRHVVRMHRGDAIPFEGVERGEYSFLVGLGSPATAFIPETNPCHADEIELFRLVRKVCLPSFNICYSMQMFCLANGGTVGPNPAGKEVGFADIRLTPSGRKDPVLRRIGDFRTLEWHGDSVLKLPTGAVHLAMSSKSTNQIAEFDGIHYLFQCDGQAASPTVLAEWFRRDGRWALEGSGVDREATLREAMLRKAYFRRVYERIITEFITVAEPGMVRALRQ